MYRLIALSIKMALCFSLLFFTLNCDQPNPLLREGKSYDSWIETAQLNCEKYQDIAPGIDEIRFQSNGEFSLNYQLFEAAYWDFWGDYTYDQSTDVIRFTITGGNYVPTCLNDLSGTFEIITHENGDRELILRDLWLGSVLFQFPYDGHNGPDECEDVPPQCGHRFIQRAE